MAKRVAISWLLGAAVAWSACTPAKTPAPAKTADGVDQLPRLEQLWSRPGLGRFDGVVHDRIYYTVANDGRSVHAVEPASGKSLWQTLLTEPVKGWVRLRVVGEALLLAYQQVEDAVPAVVVRIQLSDGRLSWSKIVTCPGVSSEAAGTDFYLLCGEREPYRKTELVRLDSSTAAELARVPITGSVEVAQAGELCGISERTAWCARLVDQRLEKLWSVPASAIDLRVLEDRVLIDYPELVVRRASDGQVVWRRPDKTFTVGAAGRGRVLLRTSEEMEIAQISDGKSLTKFRFKDKGAGGADVMADAALVLIAPFGRGDEPIFLLDAQLKVRTIARNVVFLNHLAGDVLLSQNVGMSGFNRDNAPLEAYSLSHFAAPAKELGPYERLLAVLERHPFSYDALNALPELRKIPEWKALLEKAIDSGPERLQSPAIAVAELTADPRYVPVLRKHLERIGRAPATDEEWGRIVDLGSALSAIESPEAAAALLAFWRRIGASVAPPWRQVILRDFVASAIWNYGATKNWVECKDSVYPVVGVAPDKAVFGTKSPGVEYAVDGKRGWGAICEARTDDDGNGKLEVVTQHHGDTSGDELRPYLVLGSGQGTAIDDFVAADPQGKWVVVTRNMCVELVDVHSGKAVALRGADGSQGDAAFGPHRAASFSADGKRMLYITSNGERATVIVRELATGAERRIDPGPGALSRAFFERSARFVVMDVVAADTDGDGALRSPMIASTLGQRRCRGPVASYSGFGQLGDTPIQRIASLSDGSVKDVPRGTTYEPAEIPSPGYRLAPESEAPRGPHAPLPIGPWRWVPDR